MPRAFGSDMACELPVLYDELALGWNELFDEEPQPVREVPQPKRKPRLPVPPPYLRIGDSVDLVFHDFFQSVSGMDITKHYRK